MSTLDRLGDPAPSSPRSCLCGDPESSHGHTGVKRSTGAELRPCRRACGCEEYRPRPAVSDEAEEWLAGRTPDQDAARGDAA